MDLVVGESVRVDEVVVRVEGGVRGATVTRGDRAMPMRGTRGATEVTDLIAASGFRLSAAIDVDVGELAPARDRGGRGDDGPARIVLEAPALRDGEATQVGLVEEDGELRWIFPTGGDPRRFAIDVDPDDASLDRGIGMSAIRKGIKFLAAKAIKPVAGKAISSLAVAAEARLRPSRLRTFLPDDYSLKQAAEPDVGALAEGPALLFVHGTNSSTASGFGKLPEPWVRDLHRRYGGRVFAFDHPSISVMPSDNADTFTELIRDRLPDDASLQLDIIAHSRGGLVARELAERPRPHSRVAVRSVTFFATPNGGTPLASAEHLGEFVDVLTNLAAVVPDNPVTDALEVIFELVKDIALDVVFDSFAGIAAMTPGGEYLTALNEPERPEGLLYRAVAADFEPLNTAAMLAKLRDRLFDRVFDGAMNDLVVPTRSAYRRAGEFRIDIDERIVLDSTRSISHSTFWDQNDVLGRVDAWLDGIDGDEKPLPPDPATTDPRADIEAAMHTGDGDAVADALKAVADLPGAIGGAIEEAIVQVTGGSVEPPAKPSDSVGHVVVLPGIMGSTLATGDGTVWISPWKLANGAFADLGLDLPTAEVTATGLNMAYAGLVARLAARWRVHLFPYDWRRSIDDAADALDEFVRTTVFADGDTPVHLVAHSMGGLVARSFIGRHRRTWNRMDDGATHEKGGRLVMLGTPNRGSFAIPLALAGNDMLVKGLAAVDLRNDRDDLSRIVATFPGMYQMLPAPGLVPGDDHERLYGPAGWTGVAEVDPDLLTMAREFHERLADKHRPDEDGPRMVYVAGDKKSTPGRIRISGDEHHFGMTEAGDGRVLHTSSELPGVTTYYALTGHGGLVADDGVLAALDDLLTTGATEELSPHRFPRRDAADTGEASAATVPAGDVDRSPAIAATRGGTRATSRQDRAAVMTAALDPYVGQPAAAGVPRQGIRVRVTHASLEQAEHPVVVGHYRGIPPEGAEAFLNRRLDGALWRWFDSDDYPDEPGEALFVERAQPRPPGGIVIGLGDFGEITRAKLVRSMRAAAIERVRRVAGRGDATDGMVGISSVLVGTPGDYDLSVGVAVSALVEGFARAAAQIDAMNLDVRLGELEIVELYEVRAIRAARQLLSVVDTLPTEVADAVHIEVVDQLRSGRGGRPGLPDRENSGAWPRFEIERRLPPCPPPVPAPPGDQTGHGDPSYPCGDRVELPTPTLPSFDFTQLGRGAQVDRLSVQFDPDKIEAMIAAAIGRPAAVDESYALYEMLFPHRQKLELDDTDNLHLLLDEDSAYIPWELLYGRGVDRRSATALALRTGMLRQLRPGRGGDPVRLTGRRPEGDRALVIGDPPAGDGYSRLPGARREAIEVARMLAQRGYQVEQLVYDDTADPEGAWLEIQAALYRHPYRVIHFAAHGEVDDARPERSGLLLAPGVRLTALDLRQMSATPALVFINACHVGRTGTGVAARPTSERANVIASNLALQLMRNGVQAVVAAGWAVDDAAALSFARRVYSGLLDGEHYGAAVLQARRDAFDHGRSNTWGAYQCYGDPSFALDRKRTGWKPQPSVSATDLVERLETDYQRASDARDHDRLRSVHADVVRLERTDVARFPTVEVYEALGRTYGQLGSYDDAVWAYRQAGAADRGKGYVTLKTREQLANMEARLAAQKRRGSNPVVTPEHDVGDAAETLVDSAKAGLDDLCALERTSERLSLVASVHKKVAATMSRSAAANSRNAYRDAMLACLSDANELDPYPACNWIQLYCLTTSDVRTDELRVERQVARLLAHQVDKPDQRLADHPTLIDLVCRALGPKREQKLEDLDDAIDDLAGEHTPDRLRRRAGAGPADDFWSDACAGDIALTWFVLEPATEDYLSIAKDYYTDAIKNRSSVRDRDTVVDHLRDLADISGRGRSGQDLADSLTDLRRELEDVD